MAYFCRDKEAAKIIQERYNNDIEDRLSDGFNESDVKENPPEPPKEKLLLGEKAHYLPYRLKSLNMEVSTTYQDLEDGKESVTLEHRTQRDRLLSQYGPPQVKNYYYYKKEVKKWRFFYIFWKLEATRIG